jgi:tRNA(adenine34) deaminase
MHEVTEKMLLRRQARLEAKEEKKRQQEKEQQRLAKEKKKRDEKYMKQALTQAKKASQLGEVPIGCVIVHDGKVIARGYNRRNTDKSTLSHAEITAIRKASKKLADWRLEDCIMYVTLEPCQMCAGAIVQARIPEVVIGAMNPKAGCAGSILNILQMDEFNHQVQVTRGVLEEQCSKILKDFFDGLRKRLKT